MSNTKKPGWFQESQQALSKQVEALLDRSRGDSVEVIRNDVQKLILDLQVFQLALEQQSQEMQRAQLSPATSHSRYQQFYDRAPLGFLTLDSEGRIIDANQMDASLFGLEKGQLKGTQLISYIHPDDLDNFDFFFNHLLNNPDKQSCDFRIRRPGNILAIIECLGSSICKDDHEIEILLTLEDVTNRRQVEQTIFQLNEQLKQKVFDQTAELVASNEELRNKVQQLKQFKNKNLEREAKLNSIFNAAVEGIITINETGIIESVNASVTNILGFQESELVGSNVNMLMPSPHKEQHNSYLQHYQRTGRPKIIGYVREIEGKHKNGSLVPMDISVAEYKIDHKRYFTGIIRDVSERKRKEQLDKQHLDELAHVTRLGLMGEMASGIAHEVNQPLAAIATYCQVGLRNIQTDQPDLKKLFETIQKTETQAIRAGRIIRRMREFISSNTRHMSTVNINKLVQDVIGLCQDDCKHFEIDVHFEPLEALPDVSVDEIQIEQVLLNLVKNSIDALSGIETKKLRRLTIQNYLNHDGQIEVRVKDNGPGIDNKDQTEIFKPFYTTKKSGMGMGLSISRSIIEAHEGVLRFNSKSDKGTTFYFTLPVLGGKNAIH